MLYNKSPNFQITIEGWLVQGKICGLLLPIMNQCEAFELYKL